jgi:hypothetical protein
VKQPSSALLRELTIALHEAEHSTQAQEAMLRLLKALYPEWFESNLLKNSSGPTTESSHG